ncbi:MAG: DUF4026 domain-containing protein [Planctomycetota bacterium]|jgi:hypothetical protein
MAAGADQVDAIPDGKPGDRPDDPWHLAHAEPTSLLVPRPGRMAPAPADVLAALGATERERLAPPAPDVRWAVAADLGDGRTGVLWTEPARETPGDPGGATTGHGWVVGLQVVLDRADPLADFAAVLRRLRVAMPDAPAILDVNCARWHPPPPPTPSGDGTEGMMPAHALWVVHVVEPAGDADPPAGAWLHTHGLWRCGRPELELLEIPPDRLAAAAEVLAATAELLLEWPWPAPGASMEIGDGLGVCLQPWPEVVPYLADGVPGGAADRAPRGDDRDEVAAAHAGVRAVICGPEPRGRYRRVWSWPREAVDAVDRGDAALFRTERATRRQAALARAAWPRFRAAWDEAGADAETMFLVKAVLGPAPDADVREHLWMRVRGLGRDGIEADLLDTARAGPYRRGERLTVPPEAVTDWEIVTPAGRRGPADGVDPIPGARP